MSNRFFEFTDIHESSSQYGKTLTPEGDLVKITDIDLERLEFYHKQWREVYLPKLTTILQDKCNQRNLSLTITHTRLSHDAMGTIFTISDSSDRSDSYLVNPTPEGIGYTRVRLA